jgi:hypothetical protein
VRNLKVKPFHNDPSRCGVNLSGCTLFDTPSRGLTSE